MRQRGRLRTREGNRLRSPLFAFMALAAVIVMLLGGCAAGRSGSDKVEDIDFTVIGKNEIPEELQTIIEERKSGEFKLSYNNEAELYIVVGYGEQDCGGYSIEVPELYRTDSEIVIDTNLIGPQAKEGDVSYPYIVVKMEYRDLPIVFK